MLTSALAVLVRVIAGLEDALQLANRGLELEPTLALGRANVLGRNTTLDKPVLDRVDGLLAGLEQLDHLILGVMLAVVFGIRVGAAFMLVS